MPVIDGRIRAVIFDYFFTLAQPGPSGPIENPDLFKWLTGQEPTPDALRHNASFVVRPAAHSCVCR